jgi:Flp pilus assembly protein TadG
MGMKLAIARLRNQLRAFRTARDGNIAIIFGLASLPVVGLVGAAIDYSRANSIKADLQSSLDATALMLSKSIATETDPKKKAEAYFKAVFNRSEAANTAITVSYTPGGSSVTVSGVTSVMPKFIGIIPGLQKEINVSTASTVSWAATKLRVALALDNTGSMADNGKLIALKTATKSLVAMLQDMAQNSGDVQVALVPFANGVNVGTDNVNESWIDWAYYSTKGGGGWASSNNNGSWDSRNSSYNSNYKAGDWTDDANKTADSKHTDRDKWQGCVMDRDQDYDVKNTVPTTKTPSTLFPAIYTKYCPAPVLALGSSWAAMNTRIDAMVATGSTNQTVGLAWAWQALTPGDPFGISAPAADVQPIIILLTDGLNTENRWTTDASKIDARTQKVCDNIKAAGVIVYTVQVKGNGDPTSGVLQNCASTPDRFFALTSANEIVTTFNTIGTKLTSLRVSK